VNFLEPSPTPFDLRFRLFGTPIRVHPTFWLIMALFGWGLAGGKLNYLLVFVLCAFFSILVHEMGHSMCARLFGEPSKIVLYAFGGLALGMYHQLRGWQRFLISFAGPLAGFLLYGVASGAELWWSEIRQNHPRALPPMGKVYLDLALDYLIAINLFWNAVNLLPVYPLDGGQMLREICLGLSRSYGLQLSLGISFLTAGLIAVYSFMKIQRPELPYPPLDPTINLIFFALMGLENFMMLRNVDRERPRAERDDEPWDDRSTRRDEYDR
jgi:stage IV sporulation protein FB